MPGLDREENRPSPNTVKVKAVCQIWASAGWFRRWLRPFRRFEPPFFALALSTSLSMFCALRATPPMQLSTLPVSRGQQVAHVGRAGCRFGRGE